MTRSTDYVAGQFVDWTARNAKLEYFGGGQQILRSRCILMVFASQTGPQRVELAQTQIYEAFGSENFRSRSGDT